MAPRHGVVLTLTDAMVSEANAELASGSRCVSVGHKAAITNSTLLALREAGVRYISTRSIGCNHIHVRWAESIGISVGTVAYSPDSVADYTLMLLLMMLRNAKSVLARAQVHDYRLHEVRGRELRDLTVGVIGTGRIGAAVVERLDGFGCRVLTHDRYSRASRENEELTTLVRASDVVTLHTPLNAESHHLLSRERIEQMKSGAIVVNTGRGSLLDTKALLAALESGRLGGAALDVLEGEEGVFYADHRQKSIENQMLLRLQELPNVLITPHTAYYTDHGLSDTVENTLLKCLRFLKEERHG
jgi:D-specific alpha-keto acid dehydrogenase